MRRIIVPVFAAVYALAAVACASAERVDHVIDGDTIELTNGERVRLVQIDSTELGSGECYSRKAAQVLRSLLPEGTAVHLEADPRLDRIDSYGRLLRYVHRGRLNVNLELVRRGAATVWFYHGDRGRYASQLLAAATSARHARRGLWGACPKAVWNPLAAASTGPGSLPRPPSRHRPVAAAGQCDPSYPTVCIPPPPPDLDCRDIAYRNFPVRSPDPHHLDGGGDGRGCEH